MMVSNKGIEKFRAALQRQHNAQNTQEKLKRLNADGIRFILHAYFSGALQRWDNEDRLPEGMSIRIRHFFSRTTGKTLIEQSSHESIKDIIAEMDKDPTDVKGAHFSGFNEYVLGCKFGGWDESDDRFDDMPAFKNKHVKAALRQFGELLHDRVLNR